MPAQCIAGQIRIHQRVPEPAFAVLPRQQQVLDQQRGSNHALSVAVPYLQLVGLVVAGALMVHAADVAARALAAGATDAPFYQAKLVTVRFFVQQVLPAASGWAQVVHGGGASVADADPALL